MIAYFLNELTSDEALSSEATSSAESSATSSAASNANVFADFWNKVLNFFSENVWNIVRFFSVLVIGILVIWIIMSIVKRTMRHREVDPIIVNFTAGIIRFCLLLVLILILLSTIGVQITGITTAISAAVLAVGMALKDNLSNLANGIILVASDKYKTGDYIIVGSVEGSITEINFLFTALKTKDGKQVLMPNSTMVNSQVTNLGAYPTRRVDLTIPVAYDTDVEKVKSIIIEVMRSDGRIYLDPAPFCALKDFSASSIDLFAYCWVDGDDYWDVYYFLMETIFNELKRNNVVIPYQQIEVRQRTDEVVMPFNQEGLKPRVEKKRVKKKKRMTVDDMEESTLTEIMERSKKESEERRIEIEKKKKKEAEERRLKDAKKKEKENKE